MESPKVKSDNGITLGGHGTCQTHLLDRMKHYDKTDTCCPSYQSPSQNQVRAPEVSLSTATTPLSPRALAAAKASTQKRMSTTCSSTCTTSRLIHTQQACPFRRSRSQPENPTSDMGEQAIAQESSEIPRVSVSQLHVLRKFSVAEQDVVVCNRVRCGVDPWWFRAGRDSSQRYKRSLSVEEARLAATRKRFISSMHRHTSSRMPMEVPEDDPFEDFQHLHIETSPRKQDRPVIENNTKGLIPLFAQQPTSLTPREKAMHGRYLIRESFANGSYGQVCAAEDPLSNQEVAIKIIPKYILISPEEKQSVLREQIIQKTLDHPHIIKLLDVFEDEGAYYFILERAENGSLSNLITYAGMPEAQCRRLFYQVLLALKYLHSQNIIHHDIKPHNILLHEGDKIKLCDFGASRAFNATESNIPFAGVFGTPGYIAPELLLGHPTYGPAVDMFSAGILLYEMVFGYMPFFPPSACTHQALEFPANPTQSTQVRHLISRLLEKDPAQRITASEALQHPWITHQIGGCDRSAPTSPVRIHSPRRNGNNFQHSLSCV